MDLELEPGNAKAQTGIQAFEEETEAKNTANLKQLADECGKRLDQALRHEQMQDEVVQAKAGHWASRQFAEFNLWCSKVGIHGEGPRSIDVRLKDVPEICALLRQLLQSLHRDLNELQNPLQLSSESSKAEDGLDDAESDSSTLSFLTLSSADQDTKNPGSAMGERDLVLRRHIEDTIDRLHSHALRIESAGAKHRQQRVEHYREKTGPKHVYEGLKELASRTAKMQFPNASEAFRQRLAESFARRRIRFDYLKEHQKKRAVDMAGVLDKVAMPEKQPNVDRDDTPPPTAMMQTVPRKLTNPAQRRLHDQHTIYSATENTKLDMGPPKVQQERAESVASVVRRSPGFPPPPRFTGVSFQCPYCRLEFRAREAERNRWSQHVIQDFEPYFCTWEQCDAPFDMFNTFDGLLAHMQSHLGECYHVDTPDGEHKEFSERQFEQHITQDGNIPVELMAFIKDASRRKGAFLFDNCPFCGGYPDVLEKRFPNPDSPDAQQELRRHIKQHMVDVAFFLPPNREDLAEEDESQYADEDTAVNIRGEIEIDNEGDDTAESINASHWSLLFPDSPQYKPFEISPHDSAINAANAASAEVPPAQNDEDRKILDRISPVDYESQQCDLSHQRFPGTGQWFLDSAQFKEWLGTPGQTLLCRGILGAGKSVLAAMVVDHLETLITSRADIGLVYISFQLPGQRHELVDILSTVLKQLVRRLLPRSPLPDNLKMFYRDDFRVPRASQLKEYIQSIAANYSQIYIVADAFDELTGEAMEVILPFLSELQQERQLSIFATSRPAQHVDENFNNNWPDRLLKSWIRPDDVDADIKRYAKARLSHHPNDWIRQDHSLQDDIISSLVHVAEGIYAVYNWLDHARFSNPKFDWDDENIRQFLQSEAHIKTAGRALWETHPKYRIRYCPEWRFAAFIAAFLGSEELLVRLDDSEKSGDLRDNRGRTPLSYAGERGNLNILQLFLDNGAQVDSIDRVGRSPLSFAAEQGHLEVSQLLLEKGAKVDLQDNYSQTPLSYAARQGHLEVLQLLLEKGAKVDLQDIDSRTPLLYATRQGHLEVLQLLLEKGAKVDSQDIDSRTPLLYATRQGHLEILQLLLEKGAKVDLQDVDSRTPLSYAAARGYLEVSQLLLEKGAKVDLQDNYSQTPLFYAAEQGHLEVLQLLLEKDAKVDLQDLGSRTPLSYAAEKGHLEVLYLLLSAGASINSQDRRGQTPLHHAAQEGHKQVVKALHTAGADSDLENNLGLTPLDVAHKSVRELIIELIQEAGIKGGVESITREHGTVNSDPESEQPQDRGEVDQFPILLGASQHNMERRFVAVGSEESSLNEAVDRPRKNESTDVLAGIGEKGVFALAAGLTSAATTWSENLVLADCGIGRGPNGGSTSRQMMYYSGAAWGTPNWMSEVPWDGSYPWRVSGVAATLPNGDYWFVSIKNDAGDPNHAGVALHTYDNEPLNCWSRHIDGLYTLDDGTPCSMAYICNHAPVGSKPNPEPPKPAKPVKFSYNIKDTSVQLVGYRSASEVFDLVEITGTGAKYCADKTYSIGGTAKFDEPRRPDCTIRFACGPNNAETMRDVAKRVAMEDQTVWSHSRLTIPNCKKSVVCLNPQACVTTCHQGPDCTCDNKYVERLLTTTPSHVVIDMEGDAQSRFEYWIDCPASQNTGSCDACTIARNTVWTLDGVSWGMASAIVNGVCSAEDC
ncbi:Ankyrin repeat domain-containing protein [Paramyrothecium foliicola]|nr:Ankyrin repeat domain-containing protein [Paramyrothecium foliicola]